MRQTLTAVHRSDATKYQLRDCCLVLGCYPLLLHPFQATLAMFMFMSSYTSSFASHTAPHCTSTHHNHAHASQRYCSCGSTKGCASTFLHILSSDAATAACMSASTSNAPDIWHITPFSSHLVVSSQRAHKSLKNSAWCPENVGARWCVAQPQQSPAG